MHHLTLFVALAVPVASAWANFDPSDPLGLNVAPVPPELSPGLVDGVDRPSFDPIQRGSDPFEPTMTRKAGNPFGDATGTHAVPGPGSVVLVGAGAMVVARRRR